MTELVEVKLGVALTLEVGSGEKEADEDLCGETELEEEAE